MKKQTIEISAMELMEYQERLEYSTHKTIFDFMVNEVSVDFDRNPVWVEMAKLLEQTMVYIEGRWHDRLSWC